MNDRYLLYMTKGKKSGASYVAGKDYHADYTHQRSNQREQQPRRG
jgi:hypothetical protein